MKEENFNSFLRDMVSHHVIAILETNPEEDEIEKNVYRDFSQVQKEMPNLHKSVVFKVELDGFEKDVYREFEMPYYAPISSLAYIILYTFNTMAYHLFDIQYKKFAIFVKPIQAIIRLLNLSNEPASIFCLN